MVDVQHIEQIDWHGSCIVFPTEIRHKCFNLHHCTDLKGALFK